MFYSGELLTNLLQLGLDCVSFSFIFRIVQLVDSFR